MFSYFGFLCERRNLASVDAADLIKRFSDGAYAEARRRAREARYGLTVDGNRPPGHWKRVRKAIGRKTRRAAVDTATRYRA